MTDLKSLEWEQLEVGEGNPLEVMPEEVQKEFYIRANVVAKRLLSLADAEPHVDDYKREQLRLVEKHSKELLDNQGVDLNSIDSIRDTNTFLIMSRGLMHEIKNISEQE